jgi:uncharacterized protein (DUF362 family)
MQRRAFLKTTAAAAAAAYVPMGSFGRLLAAPQPFDLVAVRGGEPDAMFDLGIAALGGMQAFVKKGQKVVVKPNIGWDVGPERAGNTHPKLVARVIEHCLQAGAKEVRVFDHTCESWTRCYKNSGIEDAVKRAGGTIVPGHSDGYYHPVKVPQGKALTEAREHELMLEADVIINLPVLKHHSSSRLTVAMKNLMGVVWDRGAWHRNDLHQCIADYATYRKPALNIVDAYAVLRQNGPRGVSVEDVSVMKSQLLSTDMVAIDAAAAKLFGSDPADIRYIGLAAAQGVGSMALDRLNIKRIVV